MGNPLRHFALRRLTISAGIVALLLSGCASTPPHTGPVPTRETLENFALEGRFSLRQEAQNHAGRLNWRHVGQHDEVLLSSPLGQGMAEISSTPRGARLTLSDGKIHEAPDVETLTREVLAYPLPLGRLADWVRARAGSGESERDNQGRLSHLHHEGWHIDYAYDNEDPQALPMRIIAVRDGELELRLRIDSWNPLDSEKTDP